MFIIVRDDTNTCDLTAGCVGRMIGPPWTGLTPDSNPSLKDECPLFSLIPAEVVCPAFTFTRLDGFAV